MSLAVQSPHSDATSLANDIAYTASTATRGRGEKRSGGTPKNAMTSLRSEKESQNLAAWSKPDPFRSHSTPSENVISDSKQGGESVTREHVISGDMNGGSYVSPPLSDEEGEPELDVLDEIIVAAEGDEEEEEEEEEVEEQEEEEEEEQEEVLEGKEEELTEESHRGAEKKDAVDAGDDALTEEEQGTGSEMEDENAVHPGYSPQGEKDVAEPIREVRKPPGATIKLHFGRKAGRKRKADEDEDGVDASRTIESSVPPSMSNQVAEDVQMETGEVERGNDADLGDSSKRMPRKKRKWLKKGEIDLDDPIAVARQKERHGMINHALASLEKQAEMVKKGTHPQLIAMLQELERRKIKQVERNEARYNTAMQDLEAMRSHEAHQARFNWKVKREALVDDLTSETWHRMSLLHQEKNLLRRVPTAFPNLRDGRGGGGWPMHLGKLLHTKEQKLTPIAGSSKTRKDVEVGLVSFTNEDGLSDLHKMGFRRRTGKPGIRRLEAIIPTVVNPAEKDKPLVPTTKVSRVITSEVVKQSRQIIDDVHDARRARMNPVHAPRYDPVLHPALPPPMKFEYNPSNPAKPKPELYPILHPYRPTPRDKVFLPGDPPPQAGTNTGPDAKPSNPPPGTQPSTQAGPPRMINGVIPSVLAPAPPPPMSTNPRQLPPEHAMYQKSLGERERKRADDAARLKTQEMVYAEQVKARQDLMKRAANSGSMLGGGAGGSASGGLGGGGEVGQSGGGSKFELKQIPPFNPSRKEGKA